MAKFIEMIEREMRKKNVSKRLLSGKMGLHPTTVQAMFNSKTFKVHRLIEICKILDYNFFSEIAETLGVKDPLTGKKYIEQIEKLQEENKTLQIKFDLLESVIEKLGGIK